MPAFASYLEWRLGRAWAPPLFDGERLARNRKTRDPAASAKPIPEATLKKARRRTAEGLPIHSFTTPIVELGARCRNLCRLKTMRPGLPAGIGSAAMPTGHFLFGLYRQYWLRVGGQGRFQHEVRAETV